MLCGHIFLRCIRFSGSVDSLLYLLLIHLVLALIDQYLGVYLDIYFFYVVIALELDDLSLIIIIIIKASVRWASLVATGTATVASSTPSLAIDTPTPAPTY